MGRLLLIVGTSSGAGKSFLATAICRFFRRLGVKVAPFKAQNMSLNAVAVADGEMAWAQYVQALACDELPSVRFNPVLLKPVGDAKSELIVLGRSEGFVHSATFDEYRDRVRPVAYRVLGELLDEYEVVVAEGAGSPVEVNLKDRDYTNMALARDFGGEALLVADIDRGGVFAQVVGTYELLDEKERRLLKGVVINKFRGLLDILKPGLDFLEERTGIPVLAVLPYVEHVIPPEDSLDIRGKFGHPVVGVIRYPKVSNFSDLAPFSVEGVGVRWCVSPEDLEGVAAVILPGSRRVLDDLRWLRDKRLDRAIVKKARKGVAVVGICGGFHILLERLVDPTGREGGGSERGLALIPGEVVYCEEKMVGGVEVEATDRAPAWLRGRICGYRIHSGRVEVPKDLALFRTDEGVDGAVVGNVCGTHIHGIFENDGVREGFVRAIGGRPSGVCYRESLRESFDRMASLLKESPKLCNYLLEFAMGGSCGHR